MAMAFARWCTFAEEVRGGASGPADRVLTVRGAECFKAMRGL